MSISTSDKNSLVTNNAAKNVYAKNSVRIKSKILVRLHELSVLGKMYLSEKSCFRPLQKHGTHGAPANITLDL